MGVSPLELGLGLELGLTSGLRMAFSLIDGESWPLKEVVVVVVVVVVEVEVVVVEVGIVKVEK